jgi:hypothetical protein
MPEGISLKIQNNLSAEKRDLNVYHHATRSAYIISHGNTVSIPLRATGNSDYLHISVVSGPGRLEKECFVNIPSWCDFTVSSLGLGDISHSGDRILVKIPPGHPVWHLKITRPPNGTHIPAEDFISIGDTTDEVEK